MTPIIEIENLTKRYGRRTAVDDLSLIVEEGDIYGFVGPNGAGKTSTIRIISTLLEPNEGEVRVSGNTISQKPREVRRLIGYMPDFFGVYNDMQVWEYLDFFGACYQLPERKRENLIRDLLELVELSHRKEDMVDKLSRGMKQRLSLARTLIHDPQILILDEPASGLDPRARVEIRELLLELSRMGKTIFFSTHILADVAEICTRVGIIEAGKIVATGRIEELQELIIPQRQVELAILDQAEQAKAILSAISGVSKLKLSPSSSNQQKTKIKFEYAGEIENLSLLLAELISAGIPVIHFSEERRDLEQVFMRITKGLVT